MANRYIRSVAMAAPLVFLAGCAAQPAASPVDPATVAVYESVTSAPARYQVIKRLWSGSWRSAFTVPTYRSRDDAAADFRSQAASLGGNGVLNFGCYNKVISPNPPPGSPLYCDGVIVRFQ